MGRVLLAVALISAGALAYEILLTRLFSIVQWHHFAFMVISLALLGFGASGSFLTIVGRRLCARFRAAFTANALLFAAGAPLCFVAAQRVPFNALEIAWDPYQLLWLAAVYLLLMLPFLFAANCIGLALMRYPESLARTYACDLAGAGIGCFLALALLYLPRPGSAIVIVALAGVAAGAVAGIERPRGRLLASLGALAVGVALAVAVPPALDVSQFKPLAQALRVPGAVVAAVRSSPLGLLTVVENSRVPVRHAPGLSIVAPVAVPEQVAVYVDADGPVAITRHAAGSRPPEYLDYTSAALPYHLRRPRSVLVLGSGGGSDVLLALAHGAEQVTAVELNAQLVDLVRTTYGDYAGRVYDDARVAVTIADARGFVETSSAHFDLVQITGLDSGGASAAGLHALDEGYTLTVEALGDYLARLAPDGMLAITRAVKLPPRDGIKLFATAVAALDAAGAGDAAQRLAWIRGWSASTLVIKNGRIDAEELSALKAFAESRRFDVAWYPGMRREEANRFNLLPSPQFFDAASALLGAQRDAFLGRYKFDVEPASDDRPYFSNFFKWRHLPEALRLRAHGGVALLELGYVVLVGALVQAVVLGAALILAPLAFAGVRRGALGGAPRSWRAWRIVAYFTCVGLAFLFVEIAFIQKFVLFLHHPIYAVAVVLASFLLFAALGSRAVAGPRFASPRAYHIAVPGLVVAALGIAYVELLPALLARGAALAEIWRVAVAIVVLAPLAFFMGMPFTLGLRSLESEAPARIPWAWGINGCASVVSAVLATLLAVHFGFTAVIVAAAALYLLAVVVGLGGTFRARPDAVAHAARAQNLHS